MAEIERRLKYWAISPGAFKAMKGLSAYLEACGLEASLLNLVYLRISQINGCTHCIERHSRDATTQGEDRERLRILVAWRESLSFTDRERAALAWAEAVTQLHEAHDSDFLFESAARHFTENELVDLTFAVASMNAWNRIAISFRRGPADV